MRPAGSWTCSSFASVHVAVLIFPWMALPGILPAACAGCLETGKGLSSPCSGQGRRPGTSKHHKNRGAEPNALLTFALCPEPFPQDTLTSFCTFSGHLPRRSIAGRPCLVSCHVGVQMPLSGSKGRPQIQMTMGFPLISFLGPFMSHHT